MGSPKIQKDGFGIRSYPLSGQLRSQESHFGKIGCDLGPIGCWRRSLKMGNEGFGIRWRSLWDQLRVRRLTFSVKSRKDSAQYGSGWGRNSGAEDGAISKCWPVGGDTTPKSHCAVKKDLLGFYIVGLQSLSEIRPSMFQTVLLYKIYFPICCFWFEHLFQH